MPMYNFNFNVCVTFQQTRTGVFGSSMHDYCCYRYMDQDDFVFCKFHKVTPEFP